MILPEMAGFDASFLISSGLNDMSNVNDTSEFVTFVCWLTSGLLNST